LHRAVAAERVTPRERSGSIDERLGWYGASVAVDTRQDPVFPRNAIYAEAGWTALRPSESGRANTFRTDVRGYRGLVGQTVLCLRWQFAGADAPLPPYQKYLLGGAASVRGYRSGTEGGDHVAAGSVEVRVPVSSPMGVARAGFTVFADTGTVWGTGTRFSDARWRRGVGGGVFLLASVFQLSLDVGVRQGGGARVHFSTGLQF
jgi:outer membrane protein assembly factor BamA